MNIRNLISVGNGRIIKFPLVDAHSEVIAAKFADWNGELYVLAEEQMIPSCMICLNSFLEKSYLCGCNFRVWEFIGCPVIFI